MTNHFIFGYAGNKRNEVKHIEFIKNFDNLKNIEVVCEPFCGTSAFSYYLSTLYPKKFKYVLNDINKDLTELYKILKNEKLINKTNTEINKLIDEFNKFEDETERKKYYDNLKKTKTFYSWLFTNKYYSIRAGLYPPISRVKKIKPFNLKDFPIYNFLKTEKVEIMNMDATELIKKNINNEKYLYFIDPPYLLVCNRFYEFKGCNIYDYFSTNDIKNLKSKIILILENMWIIKLLFKDYIKDENIYIKKYEMSKKTTEHILISN